MNKSLTIVVDNSASILSDATCVVPSRNSRLLSLDFFRGLTIAAMILVNNPGNLQQAYWPLRHAGWNGWTPTDLVFPFFLFIVGVSAAFSLSSRLSRGASRGQLLKHVLRRGLILFVLGIYINGFPDHFGPRTLRIEGVLQRIALCYVISSICFLWSDNRERIAAIFFCLFGYWIMMRYVPVPGFGVPTHDMPLLDPDRNLSAWLDRKLLAGHLYEGTHDPESLLSTIPAVASTLLGMLSGEWLRSNRSPRTKIVTMVVFGILGIFAGEIFNVWFPINKKLWTSSFVILTAGLALILLGFCYWLLDVRKKCGNWTKPLVVFGTNAIAAYVLSESIESCLYAWRLHPANQDPLSMQEAIYQRLFHPLASGPNASLIYSISFVIVCWAPIWVMYKKRIFLKI